jgi:hypothetical protein
MTQGAPPLRAERDPADPDRSQTSLPERERIRRGRRSWSGGRYGGVCYRCKRELASEAFARDASKGSGRKSICKECDAERARRYYSRKTGRS